MPLLLFRYLLRPDRTCKPGRLGNRTGNGQKAGGGWEFMPRCTSNGVNDSSIYTATDLE